MPGTVSSGFGRSGKLENGFGEQTEEGQQKARLPDLDSKGRFAAVDTQEAGMKPLEDG